MNETEFNAAYWASQPPAVQALANIQDPAARSNEAAALASQGYPIDVPIMIWGWSPLFTMQLRESYGYTWVPSANQPALQVAPGVNVITIPGYDPNHPPAGAIKVSTEIKDYPAWHTVTPDSPHPAAVAVATKNGDSGYWELSNDSRDVLPNTREQATDGHTYQKVISGFTFAGAEYGWLPVAT